MAFDKFKNQPPKPQKNPATETTKPFVVSVNPYISIKRALHLVARINAAKPSNRLHEYSAEVHDILSKCGYFDLVEEKRNHFYNRDLPYHLARALFNMFVALDNEAFGNEPRVKIVIAGGFNAGKSSFLNYITGHQILPVDMVPTTAVPTFVFCRKNSKDVSVFGENKSGAIVGLDAKVLEHISHASSSNTAKQIATSLNRFIVEIPHAGFENIVFIDTPGFGNRDSESKSSTDDQIADNQIKTADIMIYLVRSAQGSLTDDDWSRIRAFGDKPVLLILTKNDQHSVDAAREVFDATVSLAQKYPNIKCVMSMSTRNNTYFSTNNSMLYENVCNIARDIAKDTEIMRLWHEACKLLNAEIEASEREIVLLEQKFADKKNRQNKVHKDHLEVSNALDMFLSGLKLNLIDGINEIAKTCPRTVANYICDLNLRNTYVDAARDLVELYNNTAEQKYEDLGRECKELQELMSNERDMINIFAAVKKDVKTWLSNKISELRHISYPQIPKPKIPDIFDAIFEMDNEKLIVALSQPCDITTKYNVDGYSPLTFAAANGNIQALRLMLSLTSKTDGECPSEHVRDREKRSMFDAAKQRGQIATIHFLTNHYAKIEIL